MTQQLDDWVSRLADEVIADATERNVPIVCASGISPSGPVHLGNLREVMTPHLVADEIRRRGIPCEHIISWDDFDRFRKVPAVPGVDQTWEQYIGQPLTRVPPPAGSSHASWAEHFRAAFEEGLATLGVEFRGISQTEQYTSGAYTEQTIFAMRHRAEIDAVLSRYRTLPTNDQPAPNQPAAAGTPGNSGKQQAHKQGPKLSADEQAAADEATTGSGAASEEDGSGESGYYPYKPYCSVCGTDFTTVVSFDDDTAELVYTCRCGHRETVNLNTFHNGKLVWKVDWPMRWAYEGVIFEPSGVDHQSPGSSYVVGKDLAPLFGWRRPIGPMYAFVGLRGKAKMSSSSGGVPTPVDALRIMEPQLVRWLYARRKPSQSFTVAFDAEVARLYDEWDALVAKVTRGDGQPGDIAAHHRAAGTASRELPGTPHVVAYRTLGSVVDVTGDDAQQAARILTTFDPADPVTDVAVLRPRLTCVENWVPTLDPEERTVVRDVPDTARLAALSAEERRSLALLLDGAAELPPIEDNWNLEGLTHQVYGVPKVQRGLAADQIIKGDKELSAAQREFFKLLYNLLVSKDTGPRLPTLLLIVGAAKARQLLTP